MDPLILVPLLPAAALIVHQQLRLRRLLSGPRPSRRTNYVRSSRRTRGTSKRRSSWSTARRRAAASARATAIRPSSVAEATAAFSSSTPFTLGASRLAAGPSTTPLSLSATSPSLSSSIASAAGSPGAAGREAAKADLERLGFPMTAEAEYGAR